MDGLGDIKARAESLIVFADGVDQAGWHDYACRARMVARDLLETLDALKAERSARQTIQQRHDEYVAYHIDHCFTRDGRSKAA